MISTPSSTGRSRLLRLLALALPAALVVVLLPPAGAATKDAHPEIVQCFNDSPFPGCTDTTPAGFTPVDVEISANGAQLYVLGADGTVTIVDRAANGVADAAHGCGQLLQRPG